MLQDKFLEKFLDLIKRITTNYNSFIKYAFIALIFFYFVEDWQFTRVFTYLLVLAGVILFMNYDIILDYYKHNDLKSSQPVSNPAASLEVVSNTNITQQIPEIKELPDELKNLTKYILEIKDGVDDPSYVRVINALDIHIISYNDQVAKLFDDFENKRGFYHKTCENIRDIQRLIYEEIQGLYYKVETDQYIEVANRLQSIENIMDKLDVKIEAIINADFRTDINCNKAAINLVGTPRAYDDANF